MKITALLFFAILFSSCTAQSNSSEMLIKYEAFTRGNSVEFSITKDNIIYKDNNGTKKQKTSLKLWKELIVLVDKFDPSKIGTFIPPSEERIVDKALHAMLLINLGNKQEYISQTFDHGNPPKELEPLLNILFKELKIK